MNPHPRLRLPIALFLVALLLGSGVFSLALDKRGASKTAQLDARRQADAAERALRRVPERLALDGAQAARYAELNQSGFIGNEDRIGWISTLASLQNEFKLEHLTWRLSARETSTLEPGLTRTRMELDLGPLDAAHLDHFLQRLRQQAHGRYSADACVLLPTRGGGSANCAIDWWTWNEPSAN